MIKAKAAGQFLKTATFCSLLSILLMGANAEESAPDHGPRSVTHGIKREPYIQELDLGPNGTALWKSLQSLMISKDIRDFTRLAEKFDLALIQPLNYVDTNSTEALLRDDIKGKNGIISAGRYGMGITSGTVKQNFLIFELNFDLSLMCLSRIEIERILGPGTITWPTDSNSDELPNPTRLGFKSLPGYFDIAKSGCASRFSISQDLNR